MRSMLNILKTECKVIKKIKQSEIQKLLEASSQVKICSDIQKNTILWLASSTSGKIILNILAQHNAYDVFLNENITPELLFNHPIIKEMISIRKLDANLFLWAEYEYPYSYDQEDTQLLTYFLNHPLCSSWSYNARGYLLGHEQNGKIPSHRRIACIDQAQAHAAANTPMKLYHFACLSDVWDDKKYSAEKFLQYIEESTFWSLTPLYTVPCVAPKNIIFFEAIIDWIINTRELSAFSDYFQALKNNSYRYDTTSALGISGAQDYEKNVNLLSELGSYFYQAIQAKKTLSHIVIDGQFDACAIGIFSGLMSLHMTLVSPPGHKKRIQELKNSIIAEYLSLALVRNGSAVHFPNEAISSAFGIAAKRSNYDPFILNKLSPSLITNIAKSIMCDILASGFLDANSLSVIEAFSQKQSICVTNPEDIEELSRVADILFLSDIFNNPNPIGNQTKLQREADLKDMIKNFIVPNINGAETGVFPITPELLNTIKQKQETYLKNMEIIKENNHLAIKNNLLLKFLTGSDNDPENQAAIGWITQCEHSIDGLAILLDCLKKCQNHTIQAERFFYTDTYTPVSMFEQLASNPKSLEYLMGITFINSNNDHQARIEIKYTGEPPALNQLLQDFNNDTDYVQRVYNRLLYRPGALFFWLFFLSEDLDNKVFYLELSAYLCSTNSLSEHDTFLEVLSNIIITKENIYNDLRIQALSFLKDCIKTQIQSSDFRSYLKTINYLDPKSISFEYTPIALLQNSAFIKELKLSDIAMQSVQYFYRTLTWMHTLEDLRLFFRVINHFKNVMTHIDSLSTVPLLQSIIHSQIPLWKAYEITSNNKKNFIKNISSIFNTSVDEFTIIEKDKKDQIIKLNSLSKAIQYMNDTDKLYDNLLHSYIFIQLSTFIKSCHNDFINYLKHTEGNSTLFLMLCKTDEGQAILRNKKNEFFMEIPAKTWAVAPVEGNDAGKNALWWLCHTPLGRYVLAKQTPQFFENIPAEAWTTAPTEGEDAVKNPLWGLCCDSNGLTILAYQSLQFFRNLPVKAWVLEPIWPNTGISALYCLLITPEESDDLLEIKKKLGNFYQNHIKFRGHYNINDNSYERAKKILRHYVDESISNVESSCCFFSDRARISRYKRIVLHALENPDITTPQLLSMISNALGRNIRDSNLKRRLEYIAKLEGISFGNQLEDDAHLGCDDSCSIL